MFVVVAVCVRARSKGGVDFDRVELVGTALFESAGIRLILLPHVRVGFGPRFCPPLPSSPLLPNPPITLAWVVYVYIRYIGYVYKCLTYTLIFTLNMLSQF